jgi:hypothetical protein
MKGNTMAQILIPAVATHPDRVSAVWERRRDLKNWGSHLYFARSDDRISDPSFVHEAARNAFTLASALTQYVAVPWAIDLTVNDVFALSLMIADDTVQA